MPNVVVYFSDSKEDVELLTRTDKMVDMYKSSRSEVIRQALKEFLSVKRPEAKDDVRGRKLAGLV